MQLVAPHASDSANAAAADTICGTQPQRWRIVSACMLLLCMLALAVSLMPAQAEAAGPSWKRLSGSTAYGTMAKISAQGWRSSDVVVVASFDGFWDALSASSIAGRYNAPILLTGAASLNSQTAAEIKRLGASRAIIVGGTGSVKASTANQIRNALRGSKTVNRYWGDNARNTAVCVADELGDYRSDTCVIATSAGYWDALAVSSYAYATGSPIYLTTPEGTIDELVLAAIEREGFARAVIVGGKGSVSASTEKTLSSIGIGEVKRLGGGNACDTSRLIAEWAIAQGALGANGMGVATANGYWDALCGAALCGKTKGAIVLAVDGNTSALRVASAQKTTMKTAFVLGGKGSVSDKVFAACQKATTYQTAKI